MCGIQGCKLNAKSHLLVALLLTHVLESSIRVRFNVQNPHGRLTRLCTPSPHPLHFGVHLAPPRSIVHTSNIF
ncbi:hypothetical protein SISNIDRAFT_313782 [Sistotremastrum niveocremeum HHB9708]|uniref:Secreted protein n=2 Tax=Sistotremastraceae TaxID=3402574 RepID=A0A164XY37_9AGAM|nr:hypothetical protein SISNIDRAFT_313782 [Sistotremastrum niveocremeum HHB9708]KZT40732.1 hypothetical protein SISSUDRAFT_440546 [Sistotremastrum suecicum HHB10207 ss-3]